MFVCIILKGAKMTTFRVDGGSGDDYNKDLLTRKAKEELNAQGVKKPTSEQINAEIDKLAKKTESKKDLNNAKDLKVKGFYVEKNPDENTFVDFNDGAREPKIKISYKNQEQGINSEIAISYLRDEEGNPPMKIGISRMHDEEGDSPGRIGKLVVPVELSKETIKRLQEVLEQIVNNNGNRVEIDEDTLKKINELLDKIKNDESKSKLPPGKTDIGGTYGLNENGDAPATTMALGEDGGFDIITSYSMGEEGGSAVTTAIGESGDGITTKAMNEEGGSAVTTAIGESGDGITTKATNEEGGTAFTAAIGESGDGMTTKATNEEGGTAFTAALGEDGGFETITTYAMGEEGGDSVILPDDVKEKFRKLIEDLKNKNDKPILDEKATKNILELLEKIRNGEIKLPNNEVDAGTYGLNENGDVPVTTMSIGEEGGGQITTMALGEEGGDTEPKLL